MECSRSFSLEVNPAPPPGPVWDNLLWGTATIITFGTGTASFAPSNSTSAIFQAITTGPTGSNDGSAANTASLAYAGPSANCNLAMTVAADDVTPVTGRIVIIVQVFVSAVLEGSYSIFMGDFSGPVNIPFVADGNITVTVHCESNNTTSGPQGPCSASVVGIFSNV